MAAHHIMETKAARPKPSRLGVIFAMDQAHRLAHHIAVEPWRAEGVLGYHPARRENDEVGICAPGRFAGRGQHGEDRWIGMVEADRADGVESCQLIAAWREIAVPGDNVQRAMVERRRPQRTLIFLYDLVIAL